MHRTLLTLKPANAAAPDELTVNDGKLPPRVGGIDLPPSAAKRIIRGPRVLSLRSSCPASAGVSRRAPSVKLANPTPDRQQVAEALVL